MAYRIYIDNFELSETDIEGFDGIKIRKVLSATYFGYWNNDGFGFSETSGNAKIKINNKEVANYIKTRFEKFGFKAEVKLRIEDTSNGQVSNLLVDFSDYSEIDCCFVEISFRSVGQGDLLRAREKVEYPIQLTTDFQIPIRNLPEIVNFTSGGVYENTTQTIGYNHSIPLTVKDSTFGSSSSVLINENKAFFVATDTRCINLVGSIKVLVSSYVEGDFSVILYKNDVAINTNVYPITNSLTEQTITINETINSNNGDAFKLKVLGVDVSDNFLFSYDVNSLGISITECTTDTIEWRTIKAISVKDAFKQVIQRATNGQVQLSSYIFDDSLFDGYLTNNEGLQNQISKVDVSFYKLFEELNNKYPASVSVNGNFVDIIARCKFVDYNKPYKINTVDVSREINGDFLYSNVKVGYNNWKPDSSFGAIEYNSTREFQTGYSISTNQLSLLNDWISSATIINEQLLKKKEKEEIFWIVGFKDTLKAETNEYIDADVYANDRAINLRITPTRNLQRWSKFLLTDLEFVNGTGNYTFESNDTYTNDCLEVGNVIEDNDVINDAILGNFLYKCTIDRCSVNIDNLQGIVEFEYCDETKIGIVSLVEYGTDGEDVTMEIIEYVS